MKNYKAKTVDEYIAGAPEESQQRLKELRVVIRTAVPEAEESISWGIPFYKYKGMLAGFAVFTKHLGFGFADVIEEPVVKEFNDLGYVTGKKTVQVRFDQKIPGGIIEKILKKKAKENEDKFESKKK